MQARSKVAIVGAGLSGLSCALELQRRKISFHIYEAADDIGGRVRTDLVDGFLLDRGFQVLLTSYPEVQQELDLKSLMACPFESGASIRYRNSFQRILNPLQHPDHVLAAIGTPIATIGDKLCVAKLCATVLRSHMQLGDGRRTSTAQELTNDGFSDKVINGFFRPFFGGVFLETELSTSSDLFNFLFSMFATGRAVLPAAGMGAIPKQLVSRLPPDSISLNSPVYQADAGTLILSSGESLQYDAVVVATEQPNARRLIGELSERKSKGVTCMYFAADKPPFRAPLLVLNGDEEGPINNLCIPTNVCPSYSTSGKALISVTVLNDSSKHRLNDRSVQQQLVTWFGAEVEKWQPVRTYNIQYGLPDESLEGQAARPKSLRVRKGLYVCGDHAEQASINGAMMSGRKAAIAVSEDLKI